MFLSRGKKSVCSTLFKRLCHSVTTNNPPPSLSPAVVSALAKRDEIFRKYPVSVGGGANSPREAWLESISTTVNEDPLALIRLHPDIWGVAPRVDIVADNLEWQIDYKRINYDYQLDRYEMSDRNNRPWPKKGMGKARHASRRSPIWLQGGKAHGNKGPRSFFYMIPYMHRVNGLIHTLACKFAQDDVKIVENLEIPSSDSSYLEELSEERGWAISALYVDTLLGVDEDGKDRVSENFTAASTELFHVNVMPAYGLNVHSMLKHKTLVLTLDALNHIENKLLFALRRTDIIHQKERNMNVPKITY